MSELRCSTGSSAIRTACWRPLSIIDLGAYITDKRNRPPAADPVDDLYVAWDNHVAFALENPTIYRIVYSPSLAKLPAAADEAHRLLVEWMDRCAEAGKLKLPPDVAAQATSCMAT